MTLLGLFNAMQRVTAFMLDMSRRLERQGLCGKAFRMSMSRAEIASHLGLATETVSRTLARLHDEGLIAVDGKNIVLRDVAGLEAILTAHGRE
jgi:CRP/FNR family transcriptional regulator